MKNRKYNQFYVYFALYKYFCAQYNTNIFRYFMVFSPFSHRYCCWNSLEILMQYVQIPPLFFRTLEFYYYF